MQPKLDLFSSAGMTDEVWRSYRNETCHTFCAGGIWYTWVLRRAAVFSAEGIVVKNFGALYWSNAEKGTYKKWNDFRFCMWAFSFKILDCWKLYMCKLVLCKCLDGFPTQLNHSCFESRKIPNLILNENWTFQHYTYGKAVWPVKFNRNFNGLNVKKMYSTCYAVRLCKVVQKMKVN